MIRALLRDVEAAIRHDPAAQGAAEVLLAYPGIHALALHRVSHLLWKRGFRLVARLSSHYNRFLTGVEIHPGAEIADGVFIDHGMGVVIGETSVIEEGCLIYKGVVLGGTLLERRTRHPHLHRNVVVGSNACILGAIHIGEGARIGSGSVVIRDVPPGATVVGVPGRVVPEAGRRFSEELDHASLPDPVADVMRALAGREEALAARLARLEQALNLAPGQMPSEAEGASDEKERQPGDGSARRGAGRVP
ncbi:MAG TPA: serine O-acetyltransferase [Myxococcaceae bacterium]|nr:serine O-acetyltransferase [Myxococcaceae bacterium]